MPCARRLHDHQSSTHRRGDLRGLRPHELISGASIATVADLGNRGSSFYVYTPTRALPYAPDLEAQRAWVAALRGPASRCTTRRTQGEGHGPRADHLLLDQAQRQFKRMHQILASLKCTGYVVQAQPSSRSRRATRVPAFREHPVVRVTPRFRVIRGVVSCSSLRPFGTAMLHAGAPIQTSSSTASCSRILLHEPRFAKPLLLRSDQTLVCRRSRRRLKLIRKVVSLSFARRPGCGCDRKVG